MAATPAALLETWHACEDDGDGRTRMRREIHVEDKNID
jgi:hypothetical protein